MSTIPTPEDRPNIATPDAVAPEPAEAPLTGASRIARSAREWCLTLVVVAAVLLPLRSSVADWHDVPSGSMRPTIIEGDRIWVNKLAYGLRFPFTRAWVARWDAPARGDIVTFASPADGRRLVKRVIGLPGDRISMMGNRLFVNGEPVAYTIVERDVQGTLPDGRPARQILARERLPGGAEHPIAITPGLASPSTFAEIVVPPGQYFVMGDNRDQSLDSRSLGFVDESAIYGRARHVALSLDRSNWFLPRFDRFLTRLP
jgi:signal peptidase I